MRPRLVGFAGYSGVGKDTAASLLEGFVRWNFGDLIKEELDPAISAHMGFSLRDCTREQKNSVRRTLEAWGEDNYERLYTEYFADVDYYLRKGYSVCSTRIARVEEAGGWHDRGGVIIGLTNPAVGPATPLEATWWQALHPHLDVLLAAPTCDSDHMRFRREMYTFLER